MGIVGVLGSHGKTPVVIFPEGQQEGVGGVEVSDVLESKFLDQPILQGLVGSLHPPLRLWAIGVDGGDIEGLQGTSELGEFALALWMIDAEDAVFVRVQVHRTPVLAQIRRQSGTEIRIAFPHQSQHSGMYQRVHRVVRALAPATGHQTPRPDLTIAAHQTLDLPNAQVQLLGRFALTQAFVDNGFHDPYPVQFPLAQRNRPLCHESPQNEKGVILKLHKGDITTLR